MVSAGEKAPSHPSTIKASKRIGNRKWVTGFRDGQTIFREAYDLTVDRHEQHPIDEQNGKMSEFVDNIQSRIGEAPQTKTEDESVNEALRALGYIE